MFLVDARDLTENDQWEISGVIEKVSDEYYQPVLYYTVCIKRKPLYYAMVLVLPIVTIYLLSGLSFFLPPDTGEKVAFAMTVLLAQIVAYAALSDIFPAGSNNLPLLLYFVGSVMLHMALLCFMAVTGMSFWLNFFHFFLRF